MKSLNSYLFFILMFFFSFGCGNLFSQNATNEKQVSNCILLGSDSVAYYYGSSNKMNELVRGNINDSVFIFHIIKSIKEHSENKNFKVAFKPTDANDVRKNVVDIINLFNLYDIQNRYIDTLDENEQKFFHSETMPAVIAEMNRNPLKLTLPRNDNDTSKSSAKSPNTVTMILVNNSIYVYEGEDISNGKQYSYSDIDNYIKQQLRKISLGDFKIIIEASEDATYTNTIDILDKIKTNNIEKYTLVGLSNKDKQFVKTLKY